jgi:hypothetical protein
MLARRNTRELPLRQAEADSVQRQRSARAAGFFDNSGLTAQGL